MGLARATSDDPRVKDVLRDLQRELFTIAAELATEPDKYELFQQHFAPVTPEMVEKPGNHHRFSRRRCRDAKGIHFSQAGPRPRRPLIWPAASYVPPNVGWWRMKEAGQLTNDLIIAYLNRVGDLLFVVARYQDRDLPLERATGERD